MYVLEKVCEDKEVEVAKHVCEEDEDSDTEWVGAPIQDLSSHLNSNFHFLQVRRCGGGEEETRAEGEEGEKRREGEERREERKKGERGKAQSEEKKWKRVKELKCDWLQME